MFNGDTLVAAMDDAIVIDPNRFLEKTLEDDQRVQYVTVGKAANGFSR